MPLILSLIFIGLAIPEISAQNADVYVAGTINGKAVVWKNGIVNELQCETSRYYYIIANAIYVNDNDVYVIGYTYSNGGYYTLWKNGIANDFPKGTYPKSICVSGNDVYIAGSMKIGAKYDAAVIWKNGEATYLTDGTGDALARSVSVVGNDVYVLGHDRYFDGINNNDKYIKVWKNNVVISTIKSDIFPTSMYVNGTDVYVTGGDCIWKNGIKTILGGSDATYYTNSVFVANNTVYVAGHRTSGGITDQAQLWANGNAQHTPNAAFYSVFVYDNDVYVAGIQKTASIWQPIVYKNGVITSLSNEGEAEAIFVSSSSTSINDFANIVPSIYPNPTSNSFTVDYESFIQVKIYDMLGKEVLTQNTNGKTEINVSHLQKGVYNIQLFSEGRVVGNSKIVKYE